MSSSLDENTKHLRKVFQRLQETNFIIHLDKSEFLNTKVAYLGQLITAYGVKPNPEKLKAIKIMQYQLQQNKSKGPWTN